MIVHDRRRAPPKNENGHFTRLWSPNDVSQAGTPVVPDIFRGILVWACLALAISLTACGQSSAPERPQSTATPPASRPAEPKTGWQAEWQAALEGAKREGTLTVYEGAWGPQTRVGVAQAFKDKFGLEIQWVSGGTSAALVPKLVQERRAGLYLPDVIGAAGPNVLQQMKPEGILAPIAPMLVLPEAMDPKAWTGGKLFLDKEKLLIGMSSDFGSYVARNTDLVKDGEIKSFYDILNPKWKGKIVLHDPTIIGPGNAWVFTLGGLLGLDKTRDYLREFIKLEPVLVRDYRTQVEGLARGKFAIVGGVHAPTLMEFQKLGAPVAKLRVKEGGSATAGAGALALPAGQLPHPNASRVFINWILTKEGQAIFSKGYLRPSARLDVSTAGFEESVPLPNEPVLVEDEDMIALKVQMIDVAKEIFAPLLR